ncbi:MAG: peptidoglycan editing factor PgeF [Paludibacter sp.]|nr:peptidoglycan editing factor PgeF [Paludibacter sp.]
MSYINYRIYNKFPSIAHFCTTRNGGVSVGNYASYNIGPYCGDNIENHKQNLQMLSKKLGIETEKIIIPYQTHETVVKKIDEKFFGLSAYKRIEFLSGVDGLTTDLHGVCIGVTTADCVPLTLYDPANQAIGIAHAGWRGTCGKIAGKIIEKMVKDFGTNPKNIFAVIGPSISQKAYHVGKEVLTAFDAAGFPVNEFSEFRNNPFYLDLWKANHWLLTQAGVPVHQIEITGICTFTEHKKFFSARRLGIKSGRMLSGIMLK